MMIKNEKLEPFAGMGGFLFMLYAGMMLYGEGHALYELGINAGILAGSFVAGSFIGSRLGVLLTSIGGDNDKWWDWRIIPQGEIEKRSLENAAKNGAFFATIVALLLSLYAFNVWASPVWALAAMLAGPFLPFLLCLMLMLAFLPFEILRWILEKAWHFLTRGVIRG